MKIKAIVLIIPLLLAYSTAAAADTAVEPEAPTITSIASVEPARAAPENEEKPAPLPLFYRNSIGIEVAMPGRVVPGLIYTRYITDDIFASGFGGVINPSTGAEVLLALNVYKMINEFLYLGIGAGYYFEDGRAVFVGIANPSAGFMSRITPELTLFAEGTAWFIRADINNSVDPMSGSAMLIYKLGIKYNFSWADPLPDITDRIK